VAFVALALLVVAAGADSAAAAGTPAACRGGSVREVLERRIVELPGGLEAQVLSSFAVFARPQGQSDELPVINSVEGSLRFDLSSFYPGEIRLLATLPQDRRFVAIPGFEREVPLPPASCVPKSDRKQREQLISEQDARASQPTVCVVEVGPERPGPSPGADCSLFSEVARPDAVFGVLAEIPTTAVLVPNGVSSVRIVYPHLSSIVLAVRENAYLFQMPAVIERLRKKLGRALAGLNFPAHANERRRHIFERKLSRIFDRLEAETTPRVEWLTPDGTVLRTTTAGGHDKRLVIT
jgi:hypothetical protein